MASDVKIDEIAAFLRRAALAREEARKSLSPTLKDRFLKLAEEWEQLARAAAAISVVQAEASFSPTTPHGLP